MKTLLVSSIAALLMPFAVQAQTEAQMNKIINALPVEERQQYQAAYEKAIVDPTVVAAGEDRNAAAQEYKDALKAAILAFDPSLESAIDTRPADPEIKKKLQETTAKARGEKNVKSANTKRMNADKAYRKILNETFLKIDPTIGPLLEKVSGKPAAAPAKETPAAQ